MRDQSVRHPPSGDDSAQATYPTPGAEPPPFAAAAQRMGPPGHPNAADDTCRFAAPSVAADGSMTLQANPVAPVSILWECRLHCHGPGAGHGVGAPSLPERKGGGFAHRTEKSSPPLAPQRIGRSNLPTTIELKSMATESQRQTRTCGIKKSQHRPSTACELSPPRERSHRDHHRADAARQVRLSWRGLVAHRLWPRITVVAYARLCCSTC